jgi:hypothetical protein
MNLKVYYISLILCLVAASCVEEANFENNKEKYDTLNISGQFTNDSTVQSVEIRKVSNIALGKPTIEDPISNAQVYVLENNTNRIDLNITSNGIYTTNIKGKIGNSYQLIVKYKGQTYTSASQVMLPNAKIESARLVPEKESIILFGGNIGSKNNCTVRISTGLYDGQKPINALYRFYSVYEFVEDDARITPALRTCYVADRSDIGKITPLSGKNFASNRLEDYKIFSVEHSYKFYYKYLIRVEQYAVDSASYNYWTKVRELVNPTRSVFDPPPGYASSNISSSDSDNPPYGYFTVASKEDYYLNTNSAKLGFNAESYCRPPGIDYENRKIECINCTLFPNSTTIRPSFWPL